MGGEGERRTASSHSAANDDESWCSALPQRCGDLTNGDVDAGGHQWPAQDAQ